MRFAKWTLVLSLAAALIPGASAEEPELSEDEDAVVTAIQKTGEANVKLFTTKGGPAVGLADLGKEKLIDETLASGKLRGYTVSIVICKEDPRVFAVIAAPGERGRWFSVETNYAHQLSRGLASTKRRDLTEGSSPYEFGSGEGLVPVKTKADRSREESIRKAIEEERLKEAAEQAEREAKIPAATDEELAII